MAEQLGHNKKHPIDSPTDHTSSIVTGNIIEADASGLPSDSSVTSTSVSTHISTSNIHIKTNSTTSMPTVNDDNTQGYSTNSTWLFVDQVGGDEILYACTDATTGAAIWKPFVGRGVDATIFSQHGNASGIITKGKVVYVSGSAGDNPIFSIANNTMHYHSHIKGIANNSANGDSLEVITKGRIEGVDTSLYTVGTLLHLDANGDFVSGVQVTGSHIHLGTVIKQNATSGIILVEIDQYIHSLRATSGLDLDIALGDNAGVNKLGFEKYDGTEFGKITTGGLHFDTVTEYTADTGVTIESVLLKDGNITATNIQDLTLTGFKSWSGTGDYFDDTFPSNYFNLLRDGDGYINSEYVSWTASIGTPLVSVETMTANACNWIYIDSSGVLHATITRPDTLFENNIVLFEVLYDGTSYLTVKENHAYCVPTCTSNELHKAYNAVIADSGANITRVALGTGASADDRRLKIVGATYLLDHGLDTTIPDSSGVGVTINHKYTNGSGNWLIDSTNSEFPMKYNLSGTPTAIDLNDYGIFRVYVSKDSLNSTTPTYISVMHTAQYTNLQLARTAILNGVAEPTNELFDLEIAQLGYIIVLNNASGGYLAEVQIDKEVLKSNVTGSGATNISALISNTTTNFDGILSALDSNVQNALDTIDDHALENHTGFSRGSQVKAILDITPLVAGDGLMTFSIHELFNGLNLTGIGAHVFNASSSGIITIQIHRIRGAVDVLSTLLTIDVSELDSINATTAAVINTANDDVVTGDEYRIDIDIAGTGTLGLELRFTFSN